MRRIVLASALLAAATPAFAVNYLEGAYAGGATTLDDGFDEVETDDNGFLLRGAVDVAPNVFTRLSYSSVSSDKVKFNGSTVGGGVDIDTDVLRAGFGIYGGDAFQTFGVLEYVQEKLKLDVPGYFTGSDTERGGMLSIGLRDANRGAFLWNVELGYQKLKYSYGAYFSFDLGWRVTPNLVIVWGGTGYSRVNEDDDDQQFTIGLGNLGLRYQFGSQTPASAPSTAAMHQQAVSAPPAAAAWTPPPSPLRANKVLLAATALSGLPRRSGNTLALIPAGTPLQLQASMANDEGLWWFVQYDGKQGWIPDAAFTR